RSEAEIFAVVDYRPDLLDAAPTPVVPQQPSLAVEDRIRLVHRVRVPAALAGPDDGVGPVPLPARDPVLRAGHAGLGVILVGGADVEQDMPVAPPDHLAGRHPVLLPGVVRLGAEDRVLLVLGPLQPVRARGVADGVGLVLLAAGVPQAVEL